MKELGGLEGTCLTELLESENLFGISTTTLKDMVNAAVSISHFPFVRFANEPLSHIANSAVRSSLELLPDVILETCSVPSSISSEYESYCPFAIDARKVAFEKLVPSANLIPVDGDGLLEKFWFVERYHRLYGVDAPELYSQQFMKTDTGVYQRRNGHLSHLAVHLYVNKFGKPEGTADIWIEQPKWAMQLDQYQRHLSSFWFKWEAQPNPEEMKFLREIFRVTSNLSQEVKMRLMNEKDPMAASQSQPFILNLNALLVLAGFCLVFTRYCIYV